MPGWIYDKADAHLAQSNQKPEHIQIKKHTPSTVEPEIRTHANQRRCETVSLVCSLACHRPLGHGSMIWKSIRAPSPLEDSKKTWLPVWQSHAGSIHTRYQNERADVWTMLDRTTDTCTTLQADRCYTGRTTRISIISKNTNAHGPGIMDILWFYVCEIADAKKQARTLHLTYVFRQYVFASSQVSQ